MNGVIILPVHVKASSPTMLHFSPSDPVKIFLPSLLQANKVESCEDAAVTTAVDRNLPEASTNAIIVVAK